MSATLGEFVRVMTGGSVVTKDLLADRWGKIKLAIGELQGSIHTLGQAGLKSPALEDQLTGAVSGLAAGMKEATAAARYKRLTVVQHATEAAAAAAKNQVAQNLALAKGHKELAAAVLADIDEKMARVTKSALQPAGAIPKTLVTKLDALKVEQANAASVSDVSDLQPKIAELTAIRDKAKKVGGEKVLGKFEDLSREVATLRKELSQIKDASLRKSLADALDECNEKLDLATDGKGKVLVDPAEPSKGYKTGVVTMKVGGTKMTMTALELLQALGKTVAGFKTAIRDPKSDERELMELDGPTEFGQGLTNMNNSVVTFGANHKPISPAEALALHRYMGADYRDMNSVSLGTPITDENGQVDVKKKKRLERLNELCAAALAKLPPYPKTAYPTIRAERAWNDDMIDGRYGTGKTFVAGVLWSTGAGEEKDIGKAGPKFTHSIFGKSGRDVAALSATPGEGAPKPDDPRLGIGKGEVMFPATTKFVVKKRTAPTTEEVDAVPRPKAAAAYSAVAYSPGPFTLPPPIRTTLREVT